MRRLGGLRRIGWRVGLLLLVGLAVAAWIEPRFEGGSLASLRVRSVGEVRDVLAAPIARAGRWLPSGSSSRARPAAGPAERATAPIRRVETGEPLEDLTWKDRRALDRLVEQATGETSSERSGVESSPE